MKENKPQEDKQDSNKPENTIKRFRSLLEGFDFEETSKNTSSSNNKDENEEHFPQKILDHDTVRYLRDHKERIVRTIVIGSAAVLIFSGLFLLTTTALRVVDNVMFGERAMLSTFLILIGILIIAAVYYKQILQSKYLQKLHLDMEKADDDKDKDINIDDNNKK